MRGPSSLLWILLCAASLPTPSFAGDKSFALSLPLITLGREGMLRGEYNLNAKGTVSLDWAEWGLGEKREELAKSEIDEHPGTSFSTRGRELGIMLSRYSNPKDMSGFHWGLGAGRRDLSATWLRNEDQGENDNGAAVLDENGKVHHNLKIVGTTISGRLGYRYVGESVGFMVGTYLGLKHFQNQIQDLDESGDAMNSPISHLDRISLRKRLTTAMRIGLELGWAF